MVFKQSFARQRGTPWQYFLPKLGTHLNETNHYQIPKFHMNQSKFFLGHSTIAPPMAAISALPTIDTVAAIGVAAQCYHQM